jgi:C-lobe and N-lobe beta barrels of Tf-binding protein B
MKILKTAIALAAAFVTGCASSGGAGERSGQGLEAVGEVALLLACAVAGYKGSGCAERTSGSKPATNSTVSSETAPLPSSTAPVTNVSESATPVTRGDAATQINPLEAAIPDTPPANFTRWQDHRNGAGVTAAGPGATVSIGRSADGTSVSSILAAELYPSRSAALFYDPSGSLRALDAYGLTYVSGSDASRLSTQPGIDVAWRASTVERSAFTSIPSDGVALVANPFESGWDYQSFGVWSEPQGAAVENLYANSFGAATPGSAVPSSGSASFSGKLAGMYVDPAGQGSMAAANLNVDVDFSRRTLNLASSGMSLARDPSLASAAPHLEVSGTLTYSPGSSGFSGTLVNAGGTMTGTSNGQFYGSAAQELGGTFVLAAPATVEKFVGAYGAKR